MHETESWESFFKTAFGKIKEELVKQYRLETDGSGHPKFVAVRKAIDRFPPSVKILELEVDRQKHTHLKDDLCPMITYDFDSNEYSVQYLGKLSPHESRFQELLRTEFHINDHNFVKSFVEDFRTISLYEDLSSYFHFLFYDPRRDPTQFMMDFIMLFDSHFANEFAKMYDSTPDYNKLYGLNADPVIPESELLLRYSLMHSFVRLDKGGYRKMKVEDLEQDIANIQLIPKVNEDIRKVFDRAKKLYVFGGYVYDFFVISHHYSTLALESAIKHRYYAHFPMNVKIRNKKGKEATISSIDHSRIARFCEENRKDGWDPNQIEIEGERFAYGMSSVLNWLVRNGIMTQWDSKRCDLFLQTRNHLSHPTFSPTYPNGVTFTAIKEIAHLINRMFDSLG